MFNGSNEPWRAPNPQRTEAPNGLSDNRNTNTAAQPTGAQTVPNPNSSFWQHAPPPQKPLPTPQLPFIQQRKTTPGLGRTPTSSTNASSKPTLSNNGSFSSIRSFQRSTSVNSNSPAPSAAYQKKSDKPKGSPRPFEDSILDEDVDFDDPGLLELINSTSKNDSSRDGWAPMKQGLSAVPANPKPAMGAQPQLKQVPQAPPTHARSPPSSYPPKTKTSPIAKYQAYQAAFNRASIPEASIPISDVPPEVELYSNYDLTKQANIPVNHSRNSFSNNAPSNPPSTPGNATSHLPQRDSQKRSRSFKSARSDRSSTESIPWSSSPVEHSKPVATATDTQAAAIRPQPAAESHSDIANPPGIAQAEALISERSLEPEAEADSKENAPTDGAPFQPKQAPVKKKRKLPWTTAAETKADEEELAEKKLDLSSYNWEKPSTEQVKPQRKSTREASKKATVKINEGTKETLNEAVEKRKKQTVESIFLSEEQRHILDLVVRKGQSVFFTGSAGTGKSVLLREIIAQLKRKYSKDVGRVAVTASTGLAACNIGGVTLHSFSGIGLGKEPPDQLVKKIKRNNKARMRWARTKVLIVDEISMVDGELFDKLEEVARVLRNNGRPFGGIQLVITGDFFQLPPVSENGKTSRFAFDAGSWNTSIDHTLRLKHVFRQKDPVFAEMLNEMREGRMTLESISRFKGLNRPLELTDESIAATELFSTRREVEMANNTRMAQLSGPLHRFEAVDGGTAKDEQFRTRLLEGCMAPAVLSFKKGAQVMLIKNYDEHLVNGSIGTIRGFISPIVWNYCCENEFEGDETGYPTQEEILEQLAADRPAKVIGALTKAANASEALPLVRFVLSDGTTRDLLCNRDSWKIEQPDGEVQASRVQVPLILAWALSIHKAQGQTLDRVRVDLGKVFECGQAYVALSRATSMQGLQVTRFDARKVTAHERVKEFYASLSGFSDKKEGADGSGDEEGEKLTRKFGGPVTEGQKKAALLKKQSIAQYF